MEKGLKQAMLAECVLFSQPNQSFPNCGALRFFWSNPFFSVSPNNVLWSKDFLMLFRSFVIYSSIMVTPRTVVGHIIDTQLLTLTIMPVLVSPLHWIVNLTMHVVRKKQTKKTNKLHANTERTCNSLQTDQGWNQQTSDLLTVRLN